jgi:hypothetical protein
MPSIFISYAFADEVFAEMLARHIRTQRPALDCFFYNNDRRAGEWETQLGMAIKACHCMVSILGKQPGNTQIKEMELAAQWNAMTLIPVQLPGGVPSPIGNWPADLTPINVVGDQPPELQALIAAKQIAELLKIPNFVWHEVDDVPPGYPFEYEKDIISVFKKTKQLRGREATANGNGGEATARWKAKAPTARRRWTRRPRPGANRGPRCDWA